MFPPPHVGYGRRALRFLGSRLTTAVAASAATILVLGGAAFATAVVVHTTKPAGHRAAVDPSVSKPARATASSRGSNAVVSPAARRSPAVVKRTLTTGSPQLLSGYVNFIDPLDATTYLGVGGASRAVTVPGAAGTSVLIAGTLSLFQARLSQAIPSGSVTVDVYLSGGASAITCTIAATKSSCSDAGHTLPLAADKVLKVQVVNSGAGPLYGVRWAAIFTPS